MKKIYPAKVAKYVVLAFMDSQVEFHVTWEKPEKADDNNATIEIIHPSDMTQTFCLICASLFNVGETLAWNAEHSTLDPSGNSFPEDYET